MLPEVHMDFDLRALAATNLPLLISYGLRAIGVLFAIWVSLRLAGWLQRRTTSVLLARQFDQTLSIFFGSLLRWLVIVAAVIACLGVFGIETTLSLIHISE